MDNLSLESLNVLVAALQACLLLTKNEMNMGELKKLRLNKL
jgi:hypothetical protein